MFGKIFRKELKHQFTSLTIIILIVSTFLFYYTQFIGDLKRDAVKPIPPRTGTEVLWNKGKDGLSISNEAVMKAVYENMKVDYEVGNTLKIKGINKVYEKINDEQEAVLKEAIKEIEDKSFNIDYGEFQILRERVNKALGGNTAYSEEYFTSCFASKESYEVEIKEYETILKEDRVTNAYARLFADYIGIALGFFMVFVTGFTFVRDKRYGSNELIYTREISSLKYVGGKYLADVLTAFIIVLVVAGHATWLFHGFSKITGDSISYIAFFKYTILWILPTIMFVASLSYVLQLIFDNGIVPIIIQFLFWMYSIDIHNNQITKYIIRFNEIAPYSQFQPLEHTIFVNRIFYTLLSIVLLFVAVKLWDRKRGMVDDGFRIRKKVISK